MSTVDVEIIIQRKGRGNPGRDTLAAPDAPTPRIPRIARLMALAVKFQDMVERGEVRDYADLARLGYVTRARLTQIMNPLLLAPDLQEAILSLPRDPCRRAANEHSLRQIAALVLWSDQRRSWANRINP